MTFHLPKIKIISIFFFLGAIFCPFLYADNVKITTYYPTPYADHDDVKVADNLTVGASALPAVGAIHGYVNVRGAASGRGNLNINNAILSVSPNKGAYGHDALRVDPTGSGSVFAGSPSPSNGTRLKAHVTLSGKDIYVLDRVSALSTKKYVLARGFEEAGNKKAQFAGRLDNGTPGDYGDDTYGPLRIDGYFVRLGEKMADRGLYVWQGNTETVLLGTQTPVAVAANEILMFQIGDPGDGTSAGVDSGGWGLFSTYSSREYKKDIVPLMPNQYQDVLKKIEAMDVVRYHYKNDDPLRRLRIGVLAEDAPAEMVDQTKTAVNLPDSFGFLAAALKELKVKNDSLKERLEVLERMKENSRAKNN